MKRIKTWYNPKKQTKNKPGVNLTSLFSWIAVLMVILIFWVAVAVAYRRDLVSHVIAKIEHKEQKFLANHKALPKKLGGTHSLI